MKEDLNDFSDIDDPINNAKFGNLDDNQFNDDSLFGNDFGNDYLGDGGLVPREKHADLLKELTNFSPYLREVVNNWLGLIWNEEQERYLQNPLIKPIMNIKGAMWCVGFLKTYTRNNNIITDISSEEYKYMISDIIDAVWLNLGTRDDLGILEDGDLIRVATEIQHAAELALMGAGEGKYNKMLSTTYTHNTSGQINPGGNPINMYNQQQPMQQKGIRGKLRKMLLGE